MPLDDFFAKRDKKKTKKKQNPESLMRELVNDSQSSKASESGPNSDAAKMSALLKDDEWEILDDGEKEIDLETIRINKLSVSAPDDPSKGPGTDKSNDGEATEDTKKVWAAKVAEAPAAPDEEEHPPVESQPATRGVYVPVHLRAGAKGPRAAKPDVGSVSDFPTLDAAIVTAPPASANKTSPDASQHKADDDEGWEKAGATRKTIRLTDQPTNNNPSYVPPSLRQPSSMTTGQTFESRTPRFSEDRFSAPRPSDGFGARSTGDSGGGWSRGSTIPHSAQNPSTAPVGAYSSSPSVTPARTAATSSGWERGPKTFRDTGRDKAEFELTQSNRFAGLSGT